MHGPALRIIHRCLSIIADVARTEADLKGGAGGITAAGLTDPNSGAAWVKRAMIARAESTMVLVDQSKTGRRHLEVVCTLGDINVLVSDELPGEPLASALEEAGVSIEVA